MLTQRAAGQPAEQVRTGRMEQIRQILRNLAAEWSPARQSAGTMTGHPRDAEHGTKLEKDIRHHLERTVSVGAQQFDCRICRDFLAEHRDPLGRGAGAGRHLRHAAPVGSGHLRRPLRRPLEPQADDDCLRLVHRPLHAAAGPALLAGRGPHVAHLPAAGLPFGRLGLPQARHAGLHSAAGPPLAAHPHRRHQSGHQRRVGHRRPGARSAAHLAHGDGHHPHARRGRSALRLHDAAAGPHSRARASGTDARPEARS